MITLRRTITTIQSKFLGIKNEYIQSLILAVLWQIVMTAFCYILANFVLQQNTATAENVLEGSYALKYTTNWDGTWYAWITQGSYSHTTGVSSFSAVFYPLFSLLVYIFSLGGFFDITIIGLLINTLALSVSLYFLRKIQRIVLPKLNNQWILMGAFMVAPAAGFQNWFYTEAVFCALAFGAYYFALKRNWAVCCLLLAISTSSRLPAFLFIGLCGLEYLLSVKWRPNWQIAWFLITPLGFVIFGMVLKILRGDFLLMMHAESYWWYHQFSLNVVFTYMKTFTFVIMGYSWPTGWFASYFVPLAMLVLLFLSSIYLIRKRKCIPLAVFGIVCNIFFTLNSNVISVHRYLLPVLTIHVALLTIYEEKPKFRLPVKLLYGLSFVFQIIFDLIFLSYVFAG